MRFVVDIIDKFVHVDQEHRGDVYIPISFHDKRLSSAQT